jgi:hypothetical protein
VTETDSVGLGALEDCATDEEAADVGATDVGATDDAGIDVGAADEGPALETAGAGALLMVAASPKVRATNTSC